MSAEHPINPDRFADTAGVPWDGRHFEANTWAGDDGSADAAFLSVLASFRAGDAVAEQVVEAARGTRVLIPLLADLGESGTNEAGLQVDKSAELSIVTVQTPDLQSGLPVFSSVEAMRRWNEKARPVPVEIAKAALAAAKEGNTRLVLDAGSETEFVFRRTAIAALATGKPWVHPVRSQDVIDAFGRAIDGIDQIKSFNLEDGDPLCLLDSAEILLVLVLEPGLDRQQIDEIMKSLAEAISQSFEIAEEVDSLRVKLAAL
jgi:hypothetical protein